MRPLCILIAGLLTFISAGSSLAQSAQDIQAPAKHSAYLQDGRGTILRNGTGLCWRLGEWTPEDAIPGCDGNLAPPIVKAIAPEIASPAVTAAPVQTPPPVSCEVQTVLTDGQAFAFDRATLSVAAKRHLDREFLDKLDNCRLNIISITGHTDRLGSSLYNQRLSEKRAAMVAAYLYGRGMDAAISVAGAGFAQPVHECAPHLSGPALRKCLQPNRRVVIRAQGMHQ